MFEPKNVISNDNIDELSMALATKSINSFVSNICVKFKNVCVERFSLPIESYGLSSTTYTELEICKKTLNYWP